MINRRAFQGNRKLSDRIENIVEIGDHEFIVAPDYTLWFFFPPRSLETVARRKPLNSFSVGFWLYCGMEGQSLGKTDWSPCYLNSMIKLRFGVLLYFAIMLDLLFSLSTFIGSSRLSDHTGESSLVLRLYIPPSLCSISSQFSFITQLLLSLLSHLQNSCSIPILTCSATLYFVIFQI